MSIVPLLSARELSKGFGNKVLFEGISISINPGEKLGLIGPNGSGKSTLLRMIAGIELPDSGKLYPRRDLRCSYVAQEDQFDPADSVGQVLLKACLASGLEEYEVAGRIGALLGRCGFPDQNVVVSSLSGGWKKRLAICAAWWLNRNCFY